jgi:hypothetical protein
MLCFLETRPRLAGGHTPLILATHLVGVLDCLAPLFHEKRQIDDDNPVYGEQQRLRARLKSRIACADDERVGGERHAEQHLTGPTPANRLVTRTAAKNSTKGAPVPVKGVSHTLRANVLATAAIAKR